MSFRKDAIGLLAAAGATMLLAGASPAAAQAYVNQAGPNGAGVYVNQVPPGARLRPPPAPPRAAKPRPHVSRPHLARGAAKPSTAGGTTKVAASFAATPRYPNVGSGVQIIVLAPSLDKRLPSVGPGTVNR